MEELVVDGVDLSALLGIPYVASRHPGNISIKDFLAAPNYGGNCEILVLGVLWTAGFYIKSKRSIELWHDTDFTIEAHAPYKAFDVFLFLPKGVDPHRVSEDVKKLYENGENSAELDELKKFHQGIYLGEINSFDSKDCILHLPKPTNSVIWPLTEFEKSEKEYWLFKVKRPVIKRSHKLSS